MTISVAEVKKGRSVQEVVEALGVSRCTVYKWLTRYKAGGQYALQDRSFQPLRSPRRLPVGRVAFIAAMRRMRMGSRQIAFSFSMPLAPVTMAERFIQTSIKEWAYKWAYESSEERTERLGPWLDYYNQTRPHTALNYKPPISRLADCEQPPC